MILIEHAVVVSMDEERRIFLDGSVLLEGRDIVQVGRAGDVRAPSLPERIIDGRNRLVLPGFVNTHAHRSEHVNRGVMADEIPVDRYIYFLSDFLAAEKGATREQAMQAWKQLKTMDVPKNYRSWVKSPPPKSKKA